MAVCGEMRAGGGEPRVGGEPQGELPPETSLASKYTICVSSNLKWLSPVS